MHSFFLVLKLQYTLKFFLTNKVIELLRPLLDPQTIGTRMHFHNKELLCFYFMQIKKNLLWTRNLILKKIKKK